MVSELRQKNNKKEKPMQVHTLILIAPSNYKNMIVKKQALFYIITLYNNDKNYVRTQ
jgi:hypothetical protein